jgi:RNA polymerase sigma-70 factor (ECF subfamily)
MALEDDEKKFIQLISAHDGVLHKISRIYVHDEAGRQDLFQEMVIQLWKSYSSFKGTSAFSTWMYRVSINTAITHFRKDHKQIRPIALDVATQDMPEEYKDFKLDELYAAIELLNSVEKGIVLLYLEEKTYDQMEEILGISSGTLRVKMNRIKEKLRQITKQQ